MEHSQIRSTPITVAYGDGIGPEIMEETLRILDAAHARLTYESIAIGKSVYLSGNSTGIGNEAWESLRRTKVFLKAPITTPQGGGYKSLNVTIRKAFGLYANIRPCLSYSPYVASKHPNMDVVVIRENEEDLYGGIEHRQTDEVTQCLKLISRPGTERLVRYAFEYALNHQRSKVTCFTKDNIMKLTDGLFHRVFNEVASEYPNIQSEHLIVDIGAAKLADNPEQFDVIVLPNLYGDILSDVAAEIAGSVGIASSANIGNEVAMFEAIHGSAPDLAGQNVANPSGLILSAVQMLLYLGQGSVAGRIHNAWLSTIEDGIHTFDIYSPETSKAKVGTTQFANEVIARMGETPKTLKKANYPSISKKIVINLKETKPAIKELVGIDIFIDSKLPPNILGPQIENHCEPFKLIMITNRGQKVYPDGIPETFCVDHWRCRFQHNQPGQVINHKDVINLLGQLSDAGFPFIKTEGLYTFDGEPGFSLGQGQ